MPTVQGARSGMLTNLSHKLDKAKGSKKGSGKEMDLLRATRDPF